MGRTPCCSGSGLHRGPWTDKEDELLIKYIQANGEGHWRSLPKNAGLLRCGKSCRLRWRNYLRQDIKRGNITPEEDDLIIRLHTLLGNRWSLIAGRLPGRTDNEIKNYWNHHLSRRLIGSAKGKGPLEAPKCMITKTKIHIPKPIKVSRLSITTTNDNSDAARVDLKDGEQALVHKKQDCFASNFGGQYSLPAIDTS
ncbi:hypothetical protein UlMin_001721 [Ulmus minor]